MSEYHTIAITRQLGSGGSYIGQEIARRLGYSYFDREIIRQAAAHLQEDENLISDRDERVCSFWEKLIHAFCVCAPEAGYTPPAFHPIHDSRLFETEARIIRNISERCNAVIVGRGAFHVLRNSRITTSLFFHASTAFRVDRLMNIYNIADKSQSEALIHDSDVNRKKFHNAIADLEWTDATNYHLTIDTGAAGFETAIETVLCFVDKIRRI